ESFVAIGVLDAHGATLQSTSTSASATAAAPVQSSHSGLVSHHRRADSDRVSIGQPVRSPDSGRVSITISRRINQPDGTFGGVAFVEVRPSRFSEFYREARLESGDLLTLVGMDGIILARRIGDRETSGEDLSKAPLFAEIAKNRSGNYAAVASLDGIERYISYRTLREYPLVVAAGKVQADVLTRAAARQSQALNVAAGVSALIALAAVMLLLGLARNKRALETISASAERLRATFSQAAVGIVHIGPDARFLHVNRKFCDITGYPAHALLALRLSDITHPDDSAALDGLGATPGASNDATIRDQEKRFVRKDGSIVWTKFSAAAVHDRFGKGEHFVAMVNDISARKRSEAQLRKVARARRVMADCNRALVHAIDEAALLQDMCATLAGPGEYRLVRVCMAHSDEEKSVHLVAQAGVDANEEADADVSWGDGERGRGTTGRAIRSGRACVVGDIEADPDLAPWHDRARAHGFRSVASLPLKRDGVAFGVLTLQAPEVNAFDSEEIGLLEELATEMAFGIITFRTRTEHARSAADLRDSEERFRRYFELGLIGMAVTLPSKRFIEVNDQLCAMLGYERSELLKLTSPTITHPDYRPEDQRQFALLMSGEIDTYSLDKQYLHTSGRAIDVTIAVRSVHGADGSLICTLAQIEDITERKRQEVSLRRAEEGLRESQRRFADMLANVQLLSVMLDTEARITYCNDYLVRLSGWNREELIGRNWFELLVPSDMRQLQEVLPSLLESGPSGWHHENQILTRTGERRLIHWNNSVLRDLAGKPIGIAGIGEDVTKRKQAEDQVRLQADLLGAVGQAVIATDLEGAITYSNRGAEQLYGWTSTEMKGRSLLEVAPVDGGGERGLERMARLHRGESWQGEIVVRRRDGTPFAAQVANSPIYDKSGALVGNIGVSSDITERKTYEGRIEYLATHDALTGLPNRNLLNDRLTQAISQAERTDTCLGIVFIDLDHFKYVNDGYGHSMGDGLLKAIAERVRGLMRGGDTVARLGGDEFVILLTSLNDPLLDASNAARRLTESFVRPFAVDGRDFTVTASMGISLYPADGSNLDELLTNADAAMYRAKELGRNDFQFYALEMSVKAIARVTLEVALRQALQLGQFALHYQPLVVIATGEVIGVEALIRWRHPELGQVSPVDFIPLAEETGLIVPIGEWVLRTACAQKKAWGDAGLPAMTVAVNLSALQLRQPGFVGLVARILDETGLDPRGLNLEITESMVMGRTDSMIGCLNELRALGITLSMDDFGTGYSNLGYLMHLPLDVLKIDRSFVRDLPTHQGAMSIARAIVSMGRSLGMRVVAEGVETMAQADFLESIWCEHAQGFMYCKPLPAAELAAWIEGHQSAGRGASPLQAVDGDGASRALVAAHIALATASVRAAPPLEPCGGDFAHPGETRQQARQ
ncbi:MAG: PAS domain S-box protein, partial [Betaproteobacteria bacterium]